MQAIGAVERAVKTVKTLSSNNEDPYIAILCCRANPIENGFSSGEVLLMGQKIHTNALFFPKLLDPRYPDKFHLWKKEKDIRIKQK